jgi:hypothetical protein
MSQYTDIIRSVDGDKFKEIFSASSRQARETYFHRHGVKAPKSKRMPKPGAKNEMRIAGLFEVLQTVEDEELTEEVIRSWLLTKRPMLAAALDHLKIEHNDGITDSDEVKKFEGLATKDLKKLVSVLEKVAEKSDIAVYLRYMGATGLDKAL